MASNFLNNAIAEAKQIKTAALASAKISLEEAFQPTLQRMISSKLSEEEGEHYNKMIKIADEQIEDVRVSFRWKSKQLNIIKQASQLIGIPYQTYIKTVLFNQSIEDIRKAKSVL